MLVLLETEFRGYPLKGQELQIPHGYVGVVSQACDSLVEEGKVKADKTFNEMTYWNYDTTPSGMDSCVKLMDWVALAQKVNTRKLRMFQERVGLLITMCVFS